MFLERLTESQKYPKPSFRERVPAAEVPRTDGKVLELYSSSSKTSDGYMAVYVQDTTAERDLY